MHFVALAYLKLLELTSHLAIAFFDHLTRLPLDRSRDRNFLYRLLIKFFNLVKNDPKNFRSSALLL